jgi:hypothetical protein
MRKQKSRTKRETRAIDRAPNDAGVIGDRIADLMLHPLNGTPGAIQRARPSVAKQLRTKRRGEGKGGNGDRER